MGTFDSPHHGGVHFIASPTSSAHLLLYTFLLSQLHHHAFLSHPAIQQPAMLLTRTRHRLWVLNQLRGGGDGEAAGCGCGGVVRASPAALVAADASVVSTRATASIAAATAGRDSASAAVTPPPAAAGQQQSSAAGAVPTNPPPCAKHTARHYLLPASASTTTSLLLPLCHQQLTLHITSSSSSGSSQLAGSRTAATQILVSCVVRGCFGNGGLLSE